MTTEPAPIVTPLPIIKSGKIVQFGPKRLYNPTLTRPKILTEGEI